MRAKPTRLVVPRGKPTRFVSRRQAHQALFAKPIPLVLPDECYDDGNEMRRLDARARAFGGADEIIQAELLAFGRASDTLEGDA